MSRRVALALSTALACAPGKSDGMTDSASTSDGTTGTTSEPTTTGSTGESLCTPGPIAGDIECISAGAAEAYWVILGLPAFADALDEDCTVVAVADDGDLQTISLECMSSSPEFQLTTSSPHVPVAVTAGATVRMQYEAIPNGEIEDSGYFMLRDDMGALLAAGLDGPAAPLSLDPLYLDVRSTTCEGFGDPCSVTQNAALEVKLGDASAVLFDGHTGSLGPAPSYQLIVEHVSREDCSNDDFFDNPDCTSPNYSAWTVNALFVRSAVP